jgi:hypothetical protein
MVRRPRPIEDAREFGRLVELERKRTPRAKLDDLFHRVRRGDPRRWKSLSTMYRLWADYKKDRKQNPLQAEFSEWWQRKLQKGGEAPKLRERRLDTGRMRYEDDD